jgi:hypothetical protein
MATSPQRRQFIKLAGLLAGAGAAPALAAGAGGDSPAAAPQGGDAVAAPGTAWSETPLRWLDGAPDSFQGVTWGVPWPQGRVPLGAAFELRDADGAAAPVQSWPLARWPDGSLKWSAHALAPQPGKRASGAYSLHLADKAPAAGASLARSSGGAIEIDTGVLQCTLPGKGELLLSTLRRAGKPLLRDGRLVLLTDARLDDEAASDGRRSYSGSVDQVAIEDNGPQRAVIKVSGSHRHADGQRLLPFVVRLYFYKNADTVRVVHTITYDADPAKAYIRGIGLRFDAPLAGPLYDRHIRFVSAEGGVFREAVRGLTGLRRDPGEAANKAQLEGLAIPSISQAVQKNIHYIPAYGDYSLLQSHADGYAISKRTAKGYGWIHAASGSRSAGAGYLGTPQGGVAFGVRNFWQSYPGQIDISNAASDLATLTLWLWAPQAQPMDLRFFHDGLGEDTYDKQRDALDITYEDYEPGFGTPYGVARTSELELQLLPATPSAAELVSISRRIQSPPTLLPPPARLYAGQAFSEFWIPASATPNANEARLHQQLDWLFDFYRAQVEQHKWYGYWDYGDVMHTYDPKRHVWRYDVGGYAWDNSELSTEIWLWHYFLYSGRPEAFRFAEAMTRHTSEVDIHHIGPFSPLGSRHAVQHWGDSSKQLRVSTAINRRFMYYLSADERLGDLLHEQADAVERLRTLIPGRKVGDKLAEGARNATVAFGTDWSSVASAWLTEWERTGNTVYRDRLLNSMATIAAQPHGFFTGISVMNLDTGAYQIDQSGKLNVSHLSAVFGLAEVCSELIRSLPGQAAFRKAWMQYGRLYSARAEEQRRELGKELGKLNLGQGHARLLGYAGVLSGERATLDQAWAQFRKGEAGLKDADFQSRRLLPPEVLQPVDEAAAISTNSAAQWGLGAIGMLALEAQASLLVQDSFRSFDGSLWAVESESGQAGKVAYASGGALVLDAPAGLTVWLAQRLSGSYEISYTRTVLSEGGPNDRVSDLNQFWEAQLPDSGQRFARSGKFESYDDLPMYYAGIGGNTNSTTRFRRYDGKERKLLKEYLQAPYLLKPNTPYRIRTVVDGQGTRIYVNDALYFAAPGAPLGGYFGFRTTQSRQKITDFQVRRLG